MIKDETRDTWHRTRQTIVAAVRTFYISLPTRSPPLSGLPRFVFPSRTLSSEPCGRRGVGRHSRNPDFRPIICIRFGKMPAVNVLCCATHRTLLRGRLRMASSLFSHTPLGKQERNRRRPPADFLHFLTARSPPFSAHPRFVFPSRTFSSEPRGPRGGGAALAES